MLRKITLPSPVLHSGLSATTHGQLVQAGQQLGDERLSVSAGSPVEYFR